MRTDAERQERAIWKLEQAGYSVTSAGAGYIVTGPDTTTTLDDLAALVALAEVVYERVWTGRMITPSA
jgi:hypothetical protein